MRVIIRLYRQHDLDLIDLYLNSDKRFNKIIRESLFAHVRNEDYRVDIPSIHGSEEKIHKAYRITVWLGSKDQDIINWLKTVKTGHRNALIKNIIRGFLPSVNDAIYLQDDEATSKVATTRHKTKDKNVAVATVSDSVDQPTPMSSDGNAGNNNQGTQKTTTSQQSAIQQVQKNPTVANNHAVDHDEELTQTNNANKESDVNAGTDNEIFDIFEQMMNNI